MDRPESLERALDRTLHFVRTCHVGADKGGGTAKPFRVCAPVRLVDVEDHNPAAAGDDHFSGCTAEA